MLIVLTYRDHISVHAEVGPVVMGRTVKVSTAIDREHAVTTRLELDLAHWFLVDAAYAPQRDWSPFELLHGPAHFFLAV